MKTMEAYEALNRLDVATSALAALAELTRVAFATGDDFRHWENGIGELYRPHIDTLEAFSETIRPVLVAATESDQRAQEDSERVHGLRRDIIASAVGNGAQAGEIAAALNMKRATIERVIRQLEGGSSEAEPQRKVG